MTADADDPVARAFRESLDDYVGSLAPLADELADAVARRDLDLVVRLAHRARGTAAFFGDVALASLAAAVEDGDPTEAAASDRVASLLSGLRAPRAVTG